MSDLRIEAAIGSMLTQYKICRKMSWWSFWFKTQTYKNNMAELVKRCGVVSAWIEKGAGSRTLKDRATDLLRGTEEWALSQGANKL